MPQWKWGKNLPKEIQDECKRAFVHRMTEENLKANPNLSSIMHGYKLRIITDEEWLATTKFPIKKDGTLDNNVHFCESHHPDYKAKEQNA